SHNYSRATLLYSSTQMSRSSLITCMPRQPPTSTLFPYTTLFRSHASPGEPPNRGVLVLEAVGEPGQPIACGSGRVLGGQRVGGQDRKSTRLNSSHVKISYAVFCLKKKKEDEGITVFLRKENRNNN